jgi:hypothetical protein
MTNDLPNDTSVADSVPDTAQDATQVSHSPSPEQSGLAAPEVPLQQEQLETISPETQEALPSPEVPAPDLEAVAEEKSTEQPLVDVAQPQPPVAGVVDKRTHKIGEDAPLETTHKLTLDADEEERDFIEHVEEEHLST